MKDGEPWIAFQWILGSADGTWLARPDGSHAHPLWPDVPVPNVEHPDWSPDGQRIAFDSSAPGSDAVSTWTMKADGSDARQAAACETPTCTQLAEPAWSPDGTKLVMQRFDASPHYMAFDIIDLATGKRHAVAATTDATKALYSPRWSRDGRQIVFELDTFTDASQNTLTGSVIATVAADGSASAAPRILTKPAMFAAYPDWSRTADLIVFNTYDGGAFEQTDEPSNLYTMRPDGSGMTQLTHFGPGQTRAVDPSWTPDGKQIIFTTYDGPDDHVRHAAFVNADGSGLRLLDGFSATHPRLRPIP